MIADIRAGRLVDDTMERHFEYLRHLKGRREIIVNEIQKANSRHRGPGTPGYHELGGERTPPTRQAGSPTHLVRDGTRREALGARETDYQGEAFGKEAGNGVDH